MARPCRHFGCANLVTRPDQRGYCDTHASERTGWSKRPDRSGSTTSRGYGWQWQKLRKLILKRDDYVCVSCRGTGRFVTATEVDHILSKAQGGTDEHENLQSLCSDCHKAKTVLDSQRGGGG